MRARLVIIHTFQYVQTAWVYDKCSRKTDLILLLQQLFVFVFRDTLFATLGCSCNCAKVNTSSDDQHQPTHAVVNKIPLVAVLDDGGVKVRRVEDETPFALNLHHKASKSRSLRESPSGSYRSGQDVHRLSIRTAVHNKLWQSWQYLMPMNRDVHHENQQN